MKTEECLGRQVLRHLQLKKLLLLRGFIIKTVQNHQISKEGLCQVIRKQQESELKSIKLVMAFHMTIAHPKSRNSKSTKESSCKY